MKKLVFIICIVLFSQVGFSQSNTFPSSGNTGIGTTSPDFRLHIKDGNGGEQLKFQRGIGVATITQDNNLNQLYIDASSGLVLNYAGGNVGIGVQNPDFKLHIKDGNGGEQLKFQRGTGVATITQDNNSSQLYINAYSGLVLNYNGGNVGIGVQNPDYRLQIKDGNGGQQLKFQRGTGTATITQDNNVSDLYIDAVSGLFLNYSGGNVGIGTSNADEKLTVKGKIHTSEVRVDLQPNVAPDYVFENDYNLTPLSEVEKYIKANKHLPEVPSAKEMEANGMNLKEMNLILLKKVEELTLHLIELKKENESLRKRVNILEKK
jgi:hypothetical protein